MIDRRPPEGRPTFSQGQDMQQDVWNNAFCTLLGTYIIRLPACLPVCLFVCLAGPHLPKQHRSAAS